MYSTSDKKFTEAAKTFISDLKKVYQASSREIAENYLLELMERKISFGHKIVAKQLGKFILSISGQLGGSTNPIEETFTKTKGSFTSLYKLVYCAIRKVEEKCCTY